MSPDLYGDEFRGEGSFEPAHPIVAERREEAEGGEGGGGGRKEEKGAGKVKRTVKSRRAGPTPVGGKGEIDAENLRRANDGDGDDDDDDDDDGDGDPGRACVI